MLQVTSYKSQVLDDFHVFEGAPIVWRSIPFEGEGPGSRLSHAALLLEHFVYVLGGGSICNL